MKNLIYNKLLEYDLNINDFEISCSNHPLIVDELIILYKGRNKMAKEHIVKELTLRIYNDLYQLKERSIESIKMVTAKKGKLTIMFFFTEDYSNILSDYIFTNSEDI